MPGARGRLLLPLAVAIACAITTLHGLGPLQLFSAPPAARPPALRTNAAATGQHSGAAAAHSTATTSSALAAALGLVAAAATAARAGVALRAVAAEEEKAVGRRGGMVLSVVATGLGLARGAPARAAEKATKDAVDKARAAIEQQIKADPNKGPTFVRLAWHSSGSYDKVSKTGGSGPGTIRFKEELAHGGNAGLDKAVAWLEPVKQANPSISYADLYTLSGVTAIKALGGPDIPWRAGRVDSMDPSDVTPDGRLPNAYNGSAAKDVGHLRDVFYRMGFNDQEIVALSGAHALGRCHADASGFVGPWTPTPTMFNNLYFKLLKNSSWEEGCIKGETCKNPQYRNTDTQQFMMLPTDIALLKDPSFKKYVDLYADDQKVFFGDFSKAFSTLLELGTKNLYVVA